MKTKLLAAVALLVQIPVLACNVPVFRYALERWPVSPYRAVVVRDKELSKEDKANYDLLEKAGNGEDGMLNLVVWNPNKEDLEKSGLNKVLPAGPAPEAMVHLLYPVATGVDKPFWSGRLSKESVAKIRGSDFRKKLVEKIVEGNSGVFILMESGDKKKDDQVAGNVEGNIKELMKEMELPAGVVQADGSVTGGAGPGAFDPINQLRSAIPLKIAFTAMRFDRKSDEVLTAMLLNLGPEREKGQEVQPLLFAVYGRARSLVPMAGEEINLDNMGGIAYFFTGACSCQMKALNPGTDLLIDHDWDRSVFGLEE